MYHILCGLMIPALLVGSKNLSRTSKIVIYILVALLLILQVTVFGNGGGEV